MVLVNGICRDLDSCLQCQRTSEWMNVVGTFGLYKGTSLLVVTSVIPLKCGVAIVTTRPRIQSQRLAFNVRSNTLVLESWPHHGTSSLGKVFVWLINWLNQVQVQTPYWWCFPISNTFFLGVKKGAGITPQGRKELSAQVWHPLIPTVPVVTQAWNSRLWLLSLLALAFGCCPLPAWKLMPNSATLCSPHPPASCPTSCVS